MRLCNHHSYWVEWIVGLTSRLSPSISSDGLENFLFILHGSKKIVKKFQTKIQSGTWPKYSLKNTKIQKNPKFWEIALQGTIVIRKWLEFWLELLTIDYDLPVTLFEFFVFFKVYFDHVPDCILVWKFFTIFFDPCRINKKIFEPIGRSWMCQTTGKQSKNAL